MSAVRLVRAAVRMAAVGATVLALAGCAVSSIERIESGGQRYVVAAATKPADDFVVASVARVDSPPVEVVRGARRAHLAAARATLVEECRKKGGLRPSTADVPPDFASRFERTGRTAGWTFTRECV